MANPDPSLAPSVAAAASAELAARFRRRPPTVEEVQDAVERALAAKGTPEVACAFAAYRNQRAGLRRAKHEVGVRDELKLSLSAIAVLKARYLRHDRSGRPVESTGEMMDRVATHVAQAEDAVRQGSAGRWAEAFAQTMRRLEFLPNSPTLMNAGTEVGLLSGCVVLPLEDSLTSIFSTLGRAALIHQAGGGTGYSFSAIRPRGDRVASTSGSASGPVSFLRIFDVASEVVREGGRRRGASMAVLDCSHPDIVEFLESKTTVGKVENFNLSVGVSDRFMAAVLSGGDHALVNPRTGGTVGRMAAAELFGRICDAAWQVGDPGLLFLDAISRANPLPSLGRITATNPCGEVPLLPYESCNLGSINLARFVRDGRVDWTGLAATVRLAVRFLDDVIDVSRYPVAELGDTARATRKVGLGVMGLAELLATLGIPYDSQPAVRLTGRLLRHIRHEARLASDQLAAERGPFPLFAASTFARRGLPPLRNAQLTSVAPTGTVSLIAGTTSGIEPMFALAFTRHILGRELREVNPLFERLARDRGFYSDELIASVNRTGSARHAGVPPDVRAGFVTALEIKPMWHLRMQAAVQRHVDAAVAKTVNLAADATTVDVRRIFIAAWKAKVKGITVYRDSSRAGQVLTLGNDTSSGRPPVEVREDYAGGCAGHACEF